ncbi:copper homeostasis protein CutC, partial [Microbispora rosea]
RAASPAQREAARTQGRLLLRTARRMWPSAALDTLARAVPEGPHHPVALGAAGASAGCTPRQAALAAAYTSVTGPATAAVRLLGLDPVTFHRAFDMTADPFAALETLAGLGIDRVLTSGQDSSALEGAPLIAELVRRAGDRLVVMPGGGITPRNVSRVVEATGAREVHFAALVDEPSPAVHLNPYPFMGGELRQPEYVRRVTSPALVAEVIAAARG